MAYQASVDLIRSFLGEEFPDVEIVDGPDIRRDAHVFHLVNQDGRPEHQLVVSGEVLADEGTETHLTNELAETIRTSGGGVVLLTSQGPRVEARFPEGAA